MPFNAVYMDDLVRTAEGGALRNGDVSSSWQMDFGTSLMTNRKESL